MADASYSDQSDDEVTNVSNIPGESLVIDTDDGTLDPAVPDTNQATAQPETDGATQPNHDPDKASVTTQPPGSAKAKAKVNSKPRRGRPPKAKTDKEEPKMEGEPKSNTPDRKYTEMATENQTLKVELAKANKEIEDLKSKNEELEKENKKYREDLESTRSILDEEQKINAGLIENQTEQAASIISNDSVAEAKPKVLLITNHTNGDKIFTSFKNTLVEWDLTTDIESIELLATIISNGSQDCILKAYDMLVVMLGQSELEQNIKSSVIYGKLVKTCLSLRDYTGRPVAIAQTVDSGTESVLLNSLIKGCAYDLKQITFYNELRQIPPNKRINGLVLTDNAAKLVAGMIESQIGEPAIVCDASDAENSDTGDDNQNATSDSCGDSISIDPQEKIIEVIKFDGALKGSVIGRNGKYINPIQNENQTYINVTSWIDNKVEQHGALIHGKRIDVINSKEQLRVVLQNAERSANISNKSENKENVTRDSKELPNTSVNKSHAKTKPNQAKSRVTAPKRKSSQHVLKTPVIKKRK